MISPFNISSKGSSSEKESKIVIVTKPLPRFIVPPGPLTVPTDPSMLKHKTLYINFYFLLYILHIILG